MGEAKNVAVSSRLENNEIGVCERFLNDPLRRQMIEHKAKLLEILPFSLISKGGNLTPFYKPEHQLLIDKIDEQLDIYERSAYPSITPAHKQV